MFNLNFIEIDMNKTIINVPPGIRYMSEWEGFQLPEYPHILDKQITGCGFTEWCIKSKFNSILISPRIILLENKEEQHPNEVFYAKNDLDAILNVDRDLHSIKKSEDEKKKLTEEIDIKSKVLLLRKQILSYIDKCLAINKPIKILVTYDSFRIVYEAIMESKYPEIFDSFYTIVDEFQSIFTDSKFKSDTELEFLNYLSKVNRLCFVSATPEMDEYLEMLDEFKDLPFYELDWGALEPGRVVNPQIEHYPCQSITDIAVKIIKTYQNGDFKKTIIQDDFGNFKEVESRELVIYVNSVKNICDIIRKAGLKYENTNVLCSGTNENRQKIRKAFNLSKGEIGGIGKVPLRDEPRKMFTLCTRTVYLGADFYSDNARSLILSDANIECLAVDITLDLPQIMGRQRLEENPWKNRAELYAKYLSKKNRKSKEEYSNYIRDKQIRTKGLLSIYEKGDNIEKISLARKYQRDAKAFNYRDDYVAVNTHNGKYLLPVFNKLSMVSELRAFQIQQVDFENRFRVLSKITNEGFTIIQTPTSNFLDEFNKKTTFIEKMRLLCEFGLLSSDILSILSQIPIEYSTYYTVLGPTKIKALNYQKSKLDNALSDKISLVIGKTGELIFNKFKIGDKLSNAEIKERLKKLYEKHNIKSTPKATDLQIVFEVKKIKIPIGNKRVDGYELLKLKE